MKLMELFNGTKEINGFNDVDSGPKGQGRIPQLVVPSVDGKERRPVFKITGKSITINSFNQLTN